MTTLRMCCSHICSCRPAEQSEGLLGACAAQRGPSREDTAERTQQGTYRPRCGPYSQATMVACMHKLPAPPTKAYRAERVLLPSPSLCLPS